MVPDYLTACYHRLYEGLVVALSPVLVVETGVAHGAATIALGRGCKAVGSTLISIDREIGEGVRGALEQTGVGPWVKLIEGDALEVLRNLVCGEWLSGLGLVVLDDEHTYEQVANEIGVVWERLVPGGVVVGHDTNAGECGGVRDAFREWGVRGSGILSFMRSQGICMIQKGW